MLKHLLLSLAVLVASPLFAADEAKTFEEGKQYQLITPAIRTANPDKIEVVEFFWYGCGHCYNFEPVIGQWKKSLGDDVDFKGSPAVWAPQMELHSKMYYAAEVLGVLDKMHLILFQAMNVDKKRLQSESEIAELFVANGVPEEDFTKAFNSFGVNSMVRQATARARAAKISGTPEIMVNGKYRISSRMGVSQAGMLEVATFLIEKERAAKGS
ncbi:MAG: thiol:disulfide interchange protein DsbA/DsbL [Proteobacteria bacterium]|nr:thiol:disulfide interchange protein DsbA/DsbL [Pseudomonadota bacterium]